MAILRVKAGPYKGKVFDISDESLVIGRDVTDGVQILDQGVSRRHAEVIRIGEMYFIKDLESRNGTFVNDKQISEELLRIGDQIRIGNSLLVFEDRQAQLRDSSRLLSDEPPAAEAAASAAPGKTICFTITRDIKARSEALPPETKESRNLTLLYRLANLVHEEKDLSRLLERAAELVAHGLGAEHLYILWTKEDVENAFEILGRYDKDGDGGSGCVSRSIIRDCLKFNRSILTSDASADKQFNTMATVVMKQLRSVICVPIALLGKNSGVMYVYSGKAEAFNADDLELAAAVGIELGTTIGLLKMLRRAEKLFRNSIQTLVSAIEMRNPESRGKSGRVASYCLSIAKELGLDTHEVRNAWLAGMLHDLGSIPLTDKERENKLLVETKKNHYAKELFKQVPELEAILPGVEAQNERWDGSGSPEGKKGEEIPVLGRILGLALELDKHLFHGSAGGEELTIKDALLKIKETASRGFDPESVNALLRAYRKGKLFDQDEEFFEAPLN